MIKADRAIAYLRQLGEEKDGAVFAMPTMQLALYYVQATGLGWYGKPLLAEMFVAGRFGPHIPRIWQQWKEERGDSHYLTGPCHVGSMPRWIREHLEWVFDHYARDRWLVPRCGCEDDECHRGPSYDTYGGDRDWCCNYVRGFLDHHEDDPRLFVIPEDLMRLYYQSQFKIWSHPELQAMKEAP